MFKSLITAAIAGTIALTSFAATPAKAADTEDILRFLAGAAILGIIVKELDDNNNRSRRDVYVVPEKKKPVSRPRYSRVLPDQCLRRFEGGSHRHFVTKRCLNRYNRAQALPRDCEIRVVGDRGPRIVWGARCLKRHGYRFS